MAASVPFLAVWLYEGCNAAVLVMQGCSVSLSMAGWLPAGVSGVSSATLSPLTKILQMALSTGLLLPLWAFLSRKRFVVAEAAVISTLAIYLASGYWEMLSTLPGVSLGLHTAIFMAGAGAVSIFLLRELGWASRLESRSPAMRDRGAPTSQGRSLTGSVIEPRASA